jgi:glycosyltransferase involved in cell wall biosynthesis
VVSRREPFEQYSYQAFYIIKEYSTAVAIEKIKIAFFADILRENQDGVTHTIFQIAHNVDPERFNFLFITPLPPKDRRRFPFPVITIPGIAFPLYRDYPIAIPWFNYRLKVALHRFKPDILHFAAPFTLGLWALHYGKKKHIPVVATYHTHFVSYIDYYFNSLCGLPRISETMAKRYMAWFYNQCAMALVPTSIILDELLSWGVGRNRLSLWGRGIDTQKFNPAFHDRTFMDMLAGPGQKRVLFVSRLVWEKEIQTVIRIHRYFQTQRPDITVVVTGDGPARSQMQQRMPGAVFTGKLTGPALSKIYASCDVFLFPSLTETFGNVVLEAMASGLIPVVAARGGPMGIVQDGVTGYWAEPKNSRDFCRKIEKVLDHPAQSAQMRDAAIKHAQAQSWSRLAQQLFTLYTQQASLSR